MKNTLIIMLVLFITLVFGLTIKGIKGNPSPAEIEDQLRVRGEPFELSPERGRYALTMSLAQDHSFFLKKDIAKFVTPDLGVVNDKFIILFSPGVSLLATPLYILGAKFNLAQVFTFSLISVFSLLNFLLIVKICSQLKVGFRSSLIGGFTYLFATPAFAYSISFYQHQITTFLLLATTTLLFSKRNLLKLTLASFLVGVSFWIDSQNPIFFIPLIVYAIDTSFNFIKKNSVTKISFHLNHLLAFLGVAVAIGSYMVYSYLVFHKPLELSGSATSVGSFDANDNPVINISIGKKDVTRFFNPRFMTHGSATLIFNQDRGIIYYAPIMLLALFGIKNVFENERKKAAALLGTLLFIFTLYLMWGDPYGGWAFGPRYLVPVFAFAGIFLAAAFTSYGKKLWFKILISVLFIYSVAVNLLGTLTTNQVPPKVEAVPLHMDWNYLLNWKMFVSGITSSFFYKTYAHKYLSLYYYAGIIFILIILVGLALVWFPREKGDK